ncbi:hypothetical protein LCGC14_0174410 [marine sediment metagenome]|uniref:Uncharacterized protein n=1 Tax=marine sediment metagenome TaxID=412755 RepID=A0A0F9V781_9ZZZZ
MKSAIRKELRYHQDLLDGPHYQGMVLDVEKVKKVKANFIQLFSDVEQGKIGRID